jgi:uncharacterized protein YjbI with pentapeptide repeats
MKVFKPLNQSLLYKAFEINRTFYLCTAVISYFPLRSSPALKPETELWKFLADALGKEAMLDMCMPKPRAEVLITGACFAPGGSAGAGEVSINIGSVNKTLYVFGDRFWRTSGTMGKAISEPKPFTRVAITYANAFGGPSFKPNPLGKGADMVEDESGAKIRPLPNIEYPAQLIGAPKDTPEPAGFGPIDLSWPQRMEKVGTYDQKWLNEQFPGLAADMDPAYFNVAPQDQWIDGFFTGNEPLSINGMHAEKKTITAVLPGIKSRCFINRKDNGGEVFEEISTKLDTVWLFPHAERGLIIWRGVTEIQTDDAADILQMLVAYEKCEDAPRAVEHYQAALAKRLDKEKGHLYMINETDLIPPGEQGGLATLVSDATNKEDALTINMRQRAVNEKAKAEKRQQEAMQKMSHMCAEYGLDARALMPSPPPPAPAPPKIDLQHLDPDEIVKLVQKAEKDATDQLAKAQADAKIKKAQALKQVRELCEKHGLDVDQVMAKFKGQRPPRPVLSAQAMIDKLKATKANVEKQINAISQQLGIDFDTATAQAKAGTVSQNFPLIEAAEKMRQFAPEDPEMVEKLNLAEEQTKAAYLKTAHHLPAPEPLDPETAAELKQQFIDRLAQGLGFDGQDFAGVDLSGMDLSGSDLKGVYLEGADLSGVDFTRADLSCAVLAWANLTAARLNQAILHSTCLGGANLSQAQVQEADLTDGVLAKSTLTGTDLSGTRLPGVDMVEAKFSQTNLSRCRLSETTFLETDFAGAQFSEAELTNVVFIKPKLKGVDFSAAKATGATFIGAAASRATFKKADLANARFLQYADLAGADFTSAILDHANLMEADLTGAVLVKASCNNANFISTNFEGADLTAITAKRANFTKADMRRAKAIGANLMEANFKHARLTEADFRWANLYGAELMRAELGATDFREANLKMTKIATWRPDDQG